METEACKTTEYLRQIHSPEDFKKIPFEKMDEVAEEIRRELIRVTSEHGGHLASNLGVVEMTMAIHQVFDTPKDHLIFDVGHQSYVHTMLTGRYDRIDLLFFFGCRWWVIEEKRLIIVSSRMSPKQGERKGSCASRALRLCFGKG